MGQNLTPKVIVGWPDGLIHKISNRMRNIHGQLRVTTKSESIENVKEPFLVQKQKT